jgi:hypothetical protein
MADTCEFIFSINEEEYKQEWEYAFEELRWAKINRNSKGIDIHTWNHSGVCLYQGKIVHFFTHKCHPYTKRNEYFSVPVSPNFKKTVESKLEEKKIEESKIEEVVNKEAKEELVVA